MKHGSFFKAIWFKSTEERNWFSCQFSMHYSRWQKALVLYALRRLSFMFKMPLAEFDESRELADLFMQYKINGSFLRKSSLLLMPKPNPSNPLQVVINDFACAEDDLNSLTQDGRLKELRLTPFSENASVGDYVRFIAEYDALVQRLDGLHVSVKLGLSST